MLLISHFSFMSSLTNNTCEIHVPYALEKSNFIYDLFDKIRLFLKSFRSETVQEHGTGLHFDVGPPYMCISST